MQTLPIELNARDGANDYIVFTWSDNDATQAVAKVYLTLRGI